MDNSVIKDFVKLASWEELLEMEKACHEKQRKLALAQKNQLKGELYRLLDKITELGFDLEIMDKRDTHMACLRNDGVKFYLIDKDRM